MSILQKLTSNLHWWNWNSDLQESCFFPWGLLTVEKSMVCREIERLREIWWGIFVEGFFALGGRGFGLLGGGWWAMWKLWDCEIVRDENSCGLVPTWSIGCCGWRRRGGTSGIYSSAIASSVFVLCFVLGTLLGCTIVRLLLELFEEMEKTVFCWSFAPPSCCWCCWCSTTKISRISDSC